MQIIQRILQHAPHVCQKTFQNVIQRSYIIFTEKFEVKPYCNINISCPFNIELNPLDVYEYVNNNKVFVQLQSDVSEVPQASIKCSQDGDTVTIIGQEKNLKDFIICNINAPVKANINVTTTKGNIMINNFNGDKLVLKSDSGNITAEKCYCDKVHLTSNSGNIICKSVMQAAQIYLNTKNNGSITTERLQGLDLIVTTENGKITTESSYCYNSCFLSQNGELDLNNTHKNVCVHITNKGALKMSGFDGTLHAILKEGDADIQISKTLGDSDITIDKKGSLNMKLLEGCQESTEFQINCKNLFVDEDVQMRLDSAEHGLFLKPKSPCLSNMQINCKNGSVTVHSSSWADMFNF